MNIDVDSHFTPPEIYDNIPARLDDAPRWKVDADGTRWLYLKHADRLIHFSKSNFSVKRHLDEMKEGGWDKACLLVALESIPIPMIGLETELFLARAWNDAVAKVVQKDDHFIGVAQVPHHDPDAAIEEARRAVKELGFNAIQIQGNWAGKNIESQEWWPFFEEIERLDVTLMSHPSANAAAGLFNPHMPASDRLERMSAGGFMGFLFMHELAIAGLVFSGILDSFPRLRFVWLETDVGWVPSMMDWLDGAAETMTMYKAQGILKNFQWKAGHTEDGLRKRPSQYFKDNFYYGIVHNSDLQLDALLPFVVNKFGLGKNIVIESDFDHAEGSLDIARQVRLVTGIDDETKERVCGRTAAELLKVKWAPSAFAQV